MKLLSSKSHGFTLTELLVVIALIGLFATVVMASASQSRSYGRDAQVRADVQTVKLAIARAMTFGNISSYPGPKDTWTCLRADSQSCGYLGVQHYKNDSVNTAFIPYMPGSVYPLPPTQVISSASYNSYMYSPGNMINASNYNPGYTGPLLLWAQENPIKSSDCRGTITAFSNGMVRSLPQNPPFKYYICMEKLQ